jgi:excisionase family DNA binding protein
MEKFSIVKRRKKGALEPGGEEHFQIIGTQGLQEQDLIEIPSSALMKQSPGNVEKETLTLAESGGDINETISINLTPEQYELVKSSQYIKYFLDGESSGVSLDVLKQRDGHIVFNFQFKKVDTVKMLKPVHVCQMLLISKSSLMNLVKSNKMRSYKIGRLRRFLLQDILDYLSRSEEFYKSPEV